MNTNTKHKKAADGAGTLERRGNRWYGRIMQADGSRPRIPLGKDMSEARAREVLAAYVERIKERELVRPKSTEQPSDAEPIVTVRQLGEAWTSGALYERYGPVNRLRPKASAQIDAWTLSKHVYPVKTRGRTGPSFGDLPVGDVTAEDVTSVMAAQPKKQASQTRLHTYQRLRRLFDLAAFPCRLRSDESNPVKRYLRPDRDPDKFFCFLYPNEVLALLRCIDIPLGRRVLYAIGAYTGLRKGSLYSLKWGGIDFEHGMITVLKAKGKRRIDGSAGGRPLYFQADPSLLVVLRAWHRHTCSPGPDEPVVRDVGCQRYHDEAKVLRDDLKVVGITRPVLFSDEPNVEPLRFHDLRSTFITWARRDGRSDAWISERSGHQSKEMLDRYTRQAQTLTDLNYQAFPDLSQAMPELSTRLST